MAKLKSQKSKRKSCFKDFETPAVDQNDEYLQLWKDILDETLEYGFFLNR